MRKDVLDWDKSPRLRLASTEVTARRLEPVPRVTIKGTLTLHRTALSQQIDAQVNVMGDRLTPNGKATVRQGGYGIESVSIAGGTLELEDEVDLSFEIVARANETG